MFFLLQPLIYDISILSRLIWAFVFVFGFYIYWGNVQYFSGEMFQRGITLTGPTLAHGTGNYTDGNLLAMLFVMAVPFIFFLGEGSKNKITKYFMYLMIPFAWHAVFLTGSRGGLVGLLVVSLYMIYRTPKKVLAVLLAGGMLVALVYQGGDIMKQRSQKIIKYENDASALQRIESWKLASVICMDNPFFGVGLGNFTLAWENYSDSDPRVAHNTFLQVAVENGIIACLLLLCIAINVAMDLHKVRLVATEKYCSDSQKVKHIGSMANALEGACLGFFVCGLFLNLGLYEIFYVFLMMIVLLKRHIVTTNID
jgi:probable O-glycosylation ligase (exosortase A-associated)